MVGTKKLHEEITSFLKKDFGVEQAHLDDEDTGENELNFKLKPDCDGTRIKEALHEHFGKALVFHTCEMGGILGILIERY